MSAELFPCRLCGFAASVTWISSSATHVRCRGCRIEICGSNAVTLWNAAAAVALRNAAAETVVPPPNLTEHEARVWRYNRGEIK